MIELLITSSLLILAVLAARALLAGRISRRMQYALWGLVLLRLLLAIGGLGMMIPGTASDIAGFVLVVGIVLYQRYSARRTAAA